MAPEIYEFRSLNGRALLLPLLFLTLIFGCGIYLNCAPQGWLLGMSGAVIAIVAQSFSAARNERRYWMTIVGYSLVHIIIFSGSDEKWIPKPTSTITPAFIFDYLLMGWAFPKLSGLRFDLN